MASAITVRAPARTAVGSRRSGSRRDIQSMSAAYPAANQDASGAGSRGSAGARPTRVNWQAWAADLTAVAESTLTFTDPLAWPDVGTASMESLSRVRFQHNL